MKTKEYQPMQEYWLTLECPECGSPFSALQGKDRSGLFCSSSWHSGEAHEARTEAYRSAGLIEE